MKTIIKEEEFGGISNSYIGIMIMYKGGGKQLFINADNI
jgi:hypothetical protein